MKAARNHVIYIVTANSVKQCSVTGVSLEVKFQGMSENKKKTIYALWRAGNLICIAKKTAGFQTFLFEADINFLKFTDTFNEV